MAKIKTVTCLLTGEEITKKQSVLVAGHRVKKDLIHIARGILINGAQVFAENWHSHSKSARNRLNALATAVCVMKQCEEIYKIDPMVFVVEINRLCENLNDPIPQQFNQKLLDYINCEEVSELNKPNVKRAIKAGFEVLKQGCVK